MRNKTGFLLIIMIALTSKVSGQVDWFPVGAKWHYQFGSFLGGGLTTIEVLSEDTLIGNYAYNKILSTTVIGYSPDALDTVTEILYVLEENRVVFGYDQYIGGSILYDFNAKVGDTLQMYFGGLSPFPFVVDSVGLIEMNGSQLAFQDIEFPGFFDQEIWKMRVVEGLGSIGSHLFHSHTVLQPFDAPSYLFRCYEDENIGLINLSYNQQDCDYLEGVTSTLEETKVTPVIFPNPVDNFVSVQYDGQSLHQLVILDILGSIRIKQLTDTHTHQSIDVHDLESGVYILLGVDQTGRTLFSRRITKFGS